MKKILVLLVSVLLFCKISNAQEIINFKAQSRQSFNDVRAALFIPKNTAPPYPLIVVQHGSSPTVSLGNCSIFGKSNDCVKTDEFSFKIMKKGLESKFAIVVIDAFTDINANKENKLSFPDATSYAHSLVAKISMDNRIDTKNIFYTGWSYGGFSVLNTIGYRSQKRWKAIAPVEAGCQYQPAAKLLPYPVLFVMGSNSHYPPKPCIYMSNKLIEAGTKSNAIIFENVDHYFGSGQSKSGVSKSLNGCTDNHVIIDNGVWRFLDGTLTNPDEAWIKCTTDIGFGGATSEKLDDVVDVVIEFFQKNSPL